MLRGNFNSRASAGTIRGVEPVCAYVELNISTNGSYTPILRVTPFNNPHGHETVIVHQTKVFAGAIIEF